MSFLRHIELCNRFDPEGFVPFLAAGTRIGFVRRDLIVALGDFPRVFETSVEAVSLRAGLGDADAQTEALAEVGLKLCERGIAPALRGEQFDASPRWGAAPVFRIDRALVPLFGIRGYGAHLNGIVGEGGKVGPETLLWIGRRAADKKVAPSKLDNIVAGGISAGYDSWETLIKEAGEEADMPADLAARARPAGAILYRFQVPEGMRDDVLFLYDITLPETFRPHNTDGEFAEFMCMKAADCLKIVAESDDFKFNVNLVLIDFALRHGLIGPDHPEYLDLVSGLGGGLIKGKK